MPKYAEAETELTQGAQDARCRAILAFARYIDREQAPYDEYSQRTFSSLPQRTQRLEAIAANYGGRTVGFNETTVANAPEAQMAAKR